MKKRFTRYKYFIRKNIEMDLNIKYTDFFYKNIKQLSKKYKNIKNDLKILLSKLKDNPYSGINLWNGFYKIRIKNSDNNKWKSWWYRVISYYDNWYEIILVSIYSKSEIENISEESINKILTNYLDKN